MRRTKLAAIAMCATVALAASAANATAASADSCTDMARQVKAALADNAQSANYDAAVKEKSFGRDFCYNSFYQVGIDHYAQALKLLGKA